MNETKHIQGLLGIDGLLGGFESGDELFGRFTLDRHLGGSAVGVVWSAEDADLDRRVAVKLYPRVAFCDEAGMRQLRRVVDAVRRVRLPGVAALHDLVEDEDWVALVMELVDGTSLATELQMIRPEGIDPGEMKDLVVQLAGSMQDVHEQHKLVHGKLSPGNIMRTPDGRVKVMDLGVARVLSDCVQRATRIEGAMGELPYLSPQQLDGEVPRPSDDIYSFGCTLYECLTGKPPFFSGEVIWEIRHGVVPPIAERRREFGLDSVPLPKVWDKIVAACLHKHTEDRPAQMREIVAHKEFAALPSTPRLDHPESGRKPATTAPPERVAAQTSTTARFHEEPVLAASASTRTFPPLDLRTALPAYDAGHANGNGAGHAAVQHCEPGATLPPRTPAAEADSPGLPPAVKKSALPTRSPAVPPIENAWKQNPHPPSDPKASRRPESDWRKLAAVLAALALVGAAGFVSLRLGAVDWFASKVRPLTVGTAAEQVREGGGSAAPEPSPVPTASGVERALAALKATRQDTAPAGAAAALQTRSDMDAAAPSPDPAEVADGELLPASTESLGSASAPEPAPVPPSPPQPRLAQVAPTEPRGMETTPPAPSGTQTLSSKIEQMFGADLENLSPEEKAAIEALRQAENARIEAEQRLEQARLQREAEARLAEFESSMQAARDAVALKESAVNQAAAAVEAVQSERTNALGDVREMMAESQELQSQLAEMERSAAAIQQRVSDLEARLDAERLAHAEATAKMQETKTRADASMEKISAVRESAAQFDTRIAEATSALNAARSELEDANTSLDAQQAQLDAMRKAIDGGNFGQAIPATQPTTPAPPPPAAQTPTTAPPAAAAPARSEPQSPPATSPAPAVDARAINPPAATGSPPSTPLENSLGMRFVPIGDVLFSIWEARRSDFATFVEETGHQPGGNWADPGFQQEPTHPVVNVTWQDAVAFCEWLTERDRAKGLIAADEFYRLPTDVEWSTAAGLASERGQTPEARDMDVTGVYPWGTEWPPPRGAGNYTGEESGSEVAIRGYNDGYKWTSPVGSFPPNAFGLYDMGGNAWEWCMDWWNNDQKQKVLRGASWYNGGLKLSLLTSCRICSSPSSTTDNYGFRPVLVPAS